MPAGALSASLNQGTAMAEPQEKKDEQAHTHAHHSHHHSSHSDHSEHHHHVSHSPALLITGANR